MPSVWKYGQMAAQGKGRVSPVSYKSYSKFLLAIIALRSKYYAAKTSVAITVPFSCASQEK